ncbi:MAG: phosphoribosylformylglycinamidine synthase subunit PurL [Solirubrobacterales bacterium]
MSDVEQAAKHRELGLTDAEYDLIVEQLGRVPNDVELAMFSLLWSEHCGYKHTRKLLRRLPTEGERVVVGPGENAGAVRLTNGTVVAFKVESHNHPSAVEPFQGAATGVGGILRDIFSLGARPIAVLDSLRFGELDDERARYLFEGVVAGIGHYGNSIGVPTGGGEVYFEAPYGQNCLVNAMCVGVTPAERVTKAAARGPGNLVVLLGASTGRDGIGGASVLASAELGEGDEQRPSVQIGDPFEEKKLMECCLELLDRELLVALQDLGAAGLTSSAPEMASAGGVGMRLDLDRVPLREDDMEPWEIVISESQERMLAVVEPDDLDDVVEACERWQTGVAAIGEVTRGDQIEVWAGGDQVADLPLAALVDGCPAYDLDPQAPDSWGYPNADVLAERVERAREVVSGRGHGPADAQQPGPEGGPEGLTEAGATLVALLGSPSIASKRWAFEQYDSIVQSRTVRRPEGADAAVLAIDGGPGGIAVTIDGNGRRVACDPYTGSVEAVLEGVQNLACVGAEPLGLTDCLNFGNPEGGEVAWQLDRSVQGLADACAELGIPVVGGNASLYNEFDGSAIYPTPVVGLVGEVADVEATAEARLQPGDAIAIVGGPKPSLEGSELAKLRGELALGLPPVDIGRVTTATELVREGVRTGQIRAAHDVSDGGLACAVAEMAVAGEVGVRIDLSDLAEAWSVAAEALLYGEGPGRFAVVGDADRLESLASDSGGMVRVAGICEGRRIELSGAGSDVSVDVSDAATAWRSLAATMEGR